MKAPYKVLFSNDTTNIETCVSPFRAKREPFRPEMLEATVDETAGMGIDVHMLQPGMGTVPWWKSRAYPFSEHVRFMKERFGMTPEQHRAWAVPAGLLEDGVNTVEITLAQNDNPCALVFLDVAVE